MKVGHPIDLRGKRCLITGAASGIGRATAIAAAGHGAELFLTDRNGEGLERVAAEIRAAGGTVTHFAAATSSTTRRWSPSPRRCTRSPPAWTW